MARFIFRLEPVLHHRERIEMERQRVFAAAMTRLADLERERDATIVRRNDMRDRLRFNHAAMESEELRATYAHCDYLDRFIVEQLGLIALARAEADAERARLVEATKEKKILETLKERRRETFVTKAAAIEQRETDDINARRFDRALSNRETAQ